MNEKLLSIVRFYFAQCVFMSNIHYKAYGRLDKVQKRNNRIVFCISASTLIVLVLKIIILEQDLVRFLNVLSFVGLLLTGVSLIFSLFSKTDINEIKVNHRIIAEEYKSLRDKYMVLIEEIMSNSRDDNDIRSNHQILLEIYDNLGKFSPPTTGEDYSRAQSGLGLKGASNEEFTWADNEIDRFLPQNLRLFK